MSSKHFIWTPFPAAQNFSAVLSSDKHEDKQDTLPAPFNTHTKFNILLKTMAQEKMVKCWIVPELEVAALEDDVFITLPRAYTQLSMPVNWNSQGSN